MYPYFLQLRMVLLVTLVATCGPACHHTHASNVATSAPGAVSGAAEAAAPVRDVNWEARAAVVHVDPGNSETHRRSESAFSTRTSSASVDSHTSSLLVQTAALSPTGSNKQPRVEQQLRDMGLDVVGIKRSRLRDPNQYNVMVEDVTYVEESERKNAWDPTTFTMTPVIHVRVISANERKSFEGTPITVRVWNGNLNANAADGYGRKLALARAELGKQLVAWLSTRVHTAPAPPAQPTHAAEVRAAQPQAAPPVSAGPAPASRVAHSSSE